MGLRMTAGTLHGLGVGPGDPELLTLKALRILRGVPVVAYPAPEGGESFARAIVAAHIAPEQGEIRIDVPMRPGPEPAAIYDEGAARIAERLEDGRDVAVLCEGDPFTYGSFAYLHDRLAHRFPVQVVPGVSSPMACAALAGRPLARRDEPLTLLPATLPDEALAARLASGDALAIMKVGRHLPRVKRLVSRSGREAVFVRRATLPDACACPLEAAGEAAPYFSMVLVGARP